MIFIGCFGQGIDSRVPCTRGWASSACRKLIIFAFLRHSSARSSTISIPQVGQAFFWYSSISSGESPSGCSLSPAISTSSVMHCPQKVHPQECKISGGRKSTGSSPYSSLSWLIYAQSSWLSIVLNGLPQLSQSNMLFILYLLWC